MSSFQPLFERNQEATVYVGNLDQKINEELLWELFVQTGPVVNVHIPRDKITNEHQGYGFVEFKTEDDADYAIKIMHMIKLYNKPIKVNKASQDKRTQEVGANLFIGNLDPEVDEKMLYDTFSTFGIILSTKIMRDPETGQSRGFGFVSYDNFDSSDTAMNSMNGQFLCNKTIHVSYAYKKDTKGERHGSAAERLLAANRPINPKAPGAFGSGSQGDGMGHQHMNSSMFHGGSGMPGGPGMQGLFNNKPNLPNLPSGISQMGSGGPSGPMSGGFGPNPYMQGNSGMMSYQDGRGSGLPPMSNISYSQGFK